MSSAWARRIPSRARGWSRRRRRWPQAEPALAPFLDLLLRTTAGLPEVLRGEVAGTTLLFPDGRLDLVEAIYAHNPLAEHFNALMARAVRALVAAVPGGKSAILEVGAGTGGATGGILEALASLQPRPSYLYSDLSLGFLQHGHERFGQRIEPLILDVTRPGEPQGVATGSCAVIVASNVLHATPDLEATLGHLRRLLAPGGFLVLNEVTAVQDFATLTFGLTDGWWAFEDAAARLPGAPLLDVGRWREALARAGFSDLTALGLPGQGDEAAMGQAVLVATRDERPVEPAAVGPRQSWPPAALPRAASSPAGGGRDLEAVLTEELASVLGVAPAAIDRRGRFMDYGVDSILGVGFVSRVNARFGLDLKPTIVFARPTVADLARHLSADLGVEAAKMPPAPESVGAPVVAPVARSADEPIAVIGMAGRFASAGDLEAFAAMLAEGRSGIGDLSARFDLDLDNPPEHLRSAAPYLRSAGALPRIDLFDPLFFRISGREAELTDPQHRIFLTEAWKALEDAGYGDVALDGADCGVFVGCHGGDYTHRMAELGIVPDSNAFTGNAASVLAGRIAYVLNLRGPAIAVDTACSSSLVAVHLACQSLRTGECRMALAGGVFLSTTLGFNVAAASAGMLSPRGRCATFDAEADGFVPGEGAGAVLLKPLSQALADGDHVIATIVGSAVNQDGRTSGITAPSPLSQAEVIRRAQGHAGVRPGEVSYVETHGTGTRLGDPIEVEGLTRAFAAEGTAPHRCALGSVKTNVGHAAHAAGIAGLLKTLLSFEKGVLYPSLHFRTENPVLELAKTPFFVQTELTPWDRPADGRRVAGVSSFGFSGTNCHLVLADAPAVVERRAAPPTAVLATLSAPTRTALAQRARDLAAWLGRHGEARLDDVAFTLGAGRSHFRERIAIIARSGEELRAHLDAEPEAGSLVGDRQVDARLAEAGQLYLDGGELDFRALFPEARRLSLPTYPFEETSYWLTPPEQSVAVAASSKPVAAAEITLPSLQAPAWVPVQPTEEERGRRVLVVGGAEDDGLVEALRAAGHQVSRAEDAAGLGAVDAEAVLVRTRGGSGAAALAPLFALVGELVGRAGASVTVVHVHDGDPAAAGAAAVAPSLVFLGSSVRFRSVGLEPGADAGVVARSIGQVLDGDASDLLLGRDGRLRERVLAPVAIPAKPSGRDFGGVWLVTGGLGGLGRRFAAHLARTRGARIAIVGQGALDAERRARLDALRAAGAEVAYAQADVGDRDQLTRAIAELEHALGPVTAVLHAAGRPGGAVIGQKGWREIEPVLRAKIDGALALDAILADRPLKAFVVFSSLAAEHGDFGQCDYAVANAALVRFAEWRAEEVRQGRRHGRTLALSWPIWSGGHAALSSEGQALFSQALGMPFLEPEAGIATFEAGLAAADAPASLVVTTGTAERSGGAGGDDKSRLRSRRTNEGRRRCLTSRAAIERRLVEMVAKQQKIDPARVRPEEGLATFGFDSIGLKELAVGLSSAFGVEITPAVFFAHGSIGALAAHLIEEHGDALAMARTPPAAPSGAPAEPAPVARAKAAPAGDDAGAVAIIGMAGRFPGAADLGGLRSLIEEGRQSVGAMPEARRRLLGLEREADPLTAGYVDGIELFDHQLFRISRRDAVHMDPQHRLAIETVWQALEDAAIAPAGTAGKAVGVFFGQQVNGYAGLIETEEGARSQLALGNIASMLPGRISFALDWHGPAEAIDTACSSGLVAVHHAVRALRDGECELAVAGAVSLILDPEDVRTTGQLGVLSPDGRCHSFDARANGYVKGEGVGVVVLKPLARALADGDPIHAVIRGSAVNHGGRAHSLTAPNAQAQRRLVETALADAGLSAAAIGYIEAHGTGTELGDPVEIEALAGAFGEGGGPGSCAIGTVKANIGHLEPAAGIAGLLKAVLAVEHGVRPALAGFETLNPYIRLEGTPFYIPTAAEPWRGAGRRRAGISSFGFTGTNAHVVIEEPPASADARIAAEEPVLLMLSAADGAQLSATVGALARRLEAEPGLDLRDVALTLMLGRNAMPLRAAVLARPGASVVATLDALAAHLDGQGAAPAECWVGGGDGKAALLTDDPEDQDYLLSLCRRNRLDRVARLWCAGASPEPRMLAEAMPWARVARRIALPGLAMRRSVCWGTLRRAGSSAGTAVSAAAHIERAVPVAPVVVPVAPEPMPAASQPAPSAPQAAEVLTKLRALMAQALYLTPDDIDDTAGFMDLGLDSILAVEVAKSINDTFGTDLQATRLFDHPNVAALAGHLVERLSEGDGPAAAAVDERVVGEVADFVRARLALALGIDAAEVAADQPLDSLGVSPEIAAGALDALNRRFGVALDLGELARCRDLRAVFLMVAGRIGRAPEEPAAAEPVVAAPVVPAKPAPAATAPAAMPLLARELAGLLFVEPDALDPDLPLAELGLDIVLATELADRLVYHFGEDAPGPRAILTAPGLRQLADSLGQPPIEASPEPHPVVVEPVPAATRDNEQKVAVVGMACRYPGAPDKDAFWRLLVEGRSGIGQVPAWRWRQEEAEARLQTPEQRSAVRWGGFIDGIDRFDPLFFNLSPRDAVLMDPQQRLFLEEAWHAFEDAGLTREQLRGSRCGVFIGVGQGDYSRLLPEDDDRLTGQLLLGNTCSILTSRISYLLDLKGPSVALDTACSSSLVAADLGVRAIREGRCDTALVGGINLMTTPQMLVMTAASGMLAPDGQCKTFDDRADGFVAGEGIGLLVLKRLDHARRDGDRVYGIVRASGTNQDGKTSGITAPNAKSQEALEVEVWEGGGIDPAGLGLIEAHGTGTRLGDPIEIDALSRAFKRVASGPSRCAIGSVKTNIGHTLAAAGAAGLIKTLLALHHRTIPPSIHYERPNRHIDFEATPFRVATAAEPWRERRLAAVSSFGFSGTNAHLVIEGVEAPPAAAQSLGGAAASPRQRARRGRPGPSGGEPRGGAGAGSAAARGRGLHAGLPTHASRVARRHPRRVARRGAGGIGRCGRGAGAPVGGRAAEGAARERGGGSGFRSARCGGELGCRWAGAGCFAAWRAVRRPASDGVRRPALLAGAA